MKELLDSYSRDLLIIKKRLYLLQSIESNLNCHVDPKSGKVEVLNIQVYEMVQDSLHMLIIDLCSYCKNFGKKGGFIRGLNNHLSKLKPRIPKKINVCEPMMIHLPFARISAVRESAIKKSRVQQRQQRLSSAGTEALERLFPSWSKDEKVTQKHVEDLLKRFKMAVKNIEEDRNIHRAHRFERESCKRSADFQPISLEGIEKTFKEIESRLSDLWMISSLTYYDFDRDLSPNTKQTARDIVDQIIHGSIGGVVGATGIPGELKRLGANKTSYYQYRETLSR